MQLRTPSAFVQAGPLMAAGLLACAVAGCLPAQQPQAPSPPPMAGPAPATARAQQPRAESRQPQPPAIAPSPASVPGRLKMALVSSWLWLDGQYVSPLSRLDYVGLFGRLLERRAGAAGGVEARTLEIEVDSASAGRALQDVLSLIEDAGYLRVVLVTSAGRFSFCTGPCGAGSPKLDSSSARRTALLVRQDGIAFWSGQIVSEDAPGGADPKLEKLLEMPRSTSDGDFEAAVRRVCSKPGSCSAVDLLFEQDLPGSELQRVVAALERAVRAPGTNTPVVSISSSPPPPAGEEPSVFVMSSQSSGRLPFVVVRQIVRRSYGVFRECYERGLMANRKLEGRVSVRFVIQQDGSVDDISNASADLPSQDVIQCVLHGFRSLRFPAPSGGTVTVDYPILLLTR